MIAGKKPLTKQVPPTPCSAEDVGRVFSLALQDVEASATTSIPSTPFEPDDPDAFPGIRLKTYAISWRIEQIQPDGTWKGVGWGKTQPLREARRVATFMCGSNFKQNEQQSTEQDPGSNDTPQLKRSRA